jgi:hypothetical protein
VRILIASAAAVPLAFDVFAVARPTPPMSRHRPPALQERACRRAGRDAAPVHDRPTRALGPDSAAQLQHARLRGRPSQKLYTHVVVHHSDFAPPPGPAEILAYHPYEAGFADIGYHFVVAHDGTIYEGGDLRFTGAHAGVSRERIGSRSRLSGEATA